MIPDAHDQKEKRKPEKLPTQRKTPKSYQHKEKLQNKGSTPETNTKNNKNRVSPQWTT